MESSYRTIRVYDLPLDATLENCSSPLACQWDIEIQSAMTYGDLVRIVHTLRQRPPMTASPPAQVSTPTFYGTHLNEPLTLPTNMPRDIVESHFASQNNPRATPANEISENTPLWYRVERYSPWILLFS